MQNVFLELWKENYTLLPKLLAMFEYKNAKEALTPNVN